MLTRVGDPVVVRRLVAVVGVCGLLGCEKIPVVEVTRVGPPVTLDAPLTDFDETVVEAAIRVCLPDAPERFEQPQDDGSLEVTAISDGAAPGVVRLALAVEGAEGGPDEDQQPFDPAFGTLRQQVAQGVSRFDTVIEGFEQIDRCSDWNTVTFGWSEVVGDGSLEIIWQARASFDGDDFAPQIEMMPLP
jgi:hypothetical protein